MTATVLPEDTTAQCVWCHDRAAWTIVVMVTDVRWFSRLCYRDITFYLCAVCQIAVMHPQGNHIVSFEMSWFPDPATDTETLRKLCEMALARAAESVLRT